MWTIMSNAWDLKADDNRTSDSLYTFVIFCEDEISEYHYFKWFETSLIKVNVIRKQKSMLTNIKKAITYCTENGILVNKGNKYELEIRSFTPESNSLIYSFHSNVNNS